MSGCLPHDAGNNSTSTFLSPKTSFLSGDYTSLRQARLFRPVHGIIFMSPVSRPISFLTRSVVGFPLSDHFVWTNARSMSRWICKQLVRQSMISKDVDGLLEV